MKTTKKQKLMSPKAEKLFDQQDRLLDQSKGQQVKPVRKVEPICQTLQRQRLRVGDVVWAFCGEWIVMMVNESRALIYPTSTKQVQFTDTSTGKQVDFAKTPKGESISANSDIPILRRLGPDGLRQMFNQANKTGVT